MTPFRKWNGGLRSEIDRNARGVAEGNSGVDEESISPVQICKPTALGLIIGNGLHGDGW